jgi:hypothetical protein
MLHRLPDGVVGLFGEGHAHGVLVEHIGPEIVADACTGRVNKVGLAIKDILKGL